MHEDMAYRSSEGALPEIACLVEYHAAQVLGGYPLDEMVGKLLLDTLGLGIQETLTFLHRERPGFERFEQWIVDTVGTPDPDQLSRYHGWLFEMPVSDGASERLRVIEDMPPVFDDAALSHWDTHGYVILPDAISAEEAAAVRSFIWRAADAKPDIPQSWYNSQFDGIMISRYHDRSLDAARRSARVHKAFAQLWGTADLWLTVDRIGFNPPATPDHPFAGSELHWDVSLMRPIPFGTQAVLYLDDTANNQGAFRCVPGFHLGIEEWLDGPGKSNPRSVDLSDQQVFVSGKAGDLVIWRQDLPHGASANLAHAPRLVQYLNYYSPRMQIRRWI
ncbi:phytanoyl-CoA dioxygenase [Erythrobacter arachoides]|uniref:Phytanoyl-CoA dioxygenase n=1 Tax=Aurantiacibacter arachoides TaxID=1850444 RepID=A0A845A7I8_9SPHN|nr:phytanoyl-CoA dioxygenase family protein [Aurantiacibacter arachoides]MXO93509.1 phytanoyl-CoA dioxygenase [Aurantiacibacter arachoides]